MTSLAPNRRSCDSFANPVRPTSNEAKAVFPTKIFSLPKITTRRPQRAAFRLRSRLSATTIARRSLQREFKKSLQQKAFPATLTNADVGGRCVSCIVARMTCRFERRRARCALPSLRQHFLKRDTVFFGLLVYSGSSAYRFPSARSEVRAISHTGGQHG